MNEKVTNSFPCWCTLRGDDGFIHGVFRFVGKTKDGEYYGDEFGAIDLMCGPYSLRLNKNKINPDDCIKVSFPEDAAIDFFYLWDDLKEAVEEDFLMRNEYRTEKMAMKEKEDEGGFQNCYCAYRGKGGLIERVYRFVGKTDEGKYFGDEFDFLNMMLLRPELNVSAEDIPASDYVEVSFEDDDNVEFIYSWQKLCNAVLRDLGNVNEMINSKD